jgi:hypothetical protein
MEADMMKRRQFILLLGGAATWTLQPVQMRRIGVLMAEQRALRRVCVLLAGLVLKATRSCLTLPWGSRCQALIFNNGISSFLAFFPILLFDPSGGLS